MFERLKEHSSRVGVRALILAPTRELALQTLRFAKQMGRFTDLRISLIVGGDSMEQQVQRKSREAMALLFSYTDLTSFLLRFPVRLSGVES